MRARKFMAILLSGLMVSTQIPVYANENGQVFEKISFEDGELFPQVIAEENVEISTTDFGAVDSERALSVEFKGYNSKQESGAILIDKEGVWDFGENSTFYFDYYNTSNSGTQVRVDVTDINGETRTNYYNIDGWNKRRIGVSDFGPKKSDFSGANGWWGAEDGLDVHNIDSVRIYQWGSPAANKCVIDNVKVLSPATVSFDPISFESGEVPEDAYMSNATASVVSNGATDGSKALKVNFGAGGFPSVRFLPEENYNWGAGSSLNFDITNPSSTAKTIYVKVVDGAGQETVGTVTVAPGKTQSAFMTFNTRAMYLGMRYFPPTDGQDRVSYAWGAKGMDVSDVKEFSFFMYTPPEEATVFIDNIRIKSDPATDPHYLDGIIDAYGQYSERDWNDKIHSDSELKNSTAKEKEWMAANPQDTSNLSKYGGWAAGPQLEATGRFRTEKYNGKWTLVDPDGYVFFATGLDILRFDDMKTWITGRENMFENVPENSHYQSINSAAVPPLGLMSGHTYNFYTANLEKKYGSNYDDAWVNTTYDRMKNWGFTTLGNWSEPSMFWGTAAQKEMPFIADAWIRGNYAVIDDGMAAGMLVPDAFDPSFKAAAKGAVNSLMGASVNTNPWCIGVYINNEISWGNPLGDTYSVIVAAMNKDAGSSAAKKAFVGYLKDKYSSIGALNSAWGTNYASFAAVEAANALQGVERTEGVNADLSTMLYMLGTEYYKTVNDYFHEMYPDCLNLGSRLAEWGCPAEIEKACAENVDVLSYNCYKESVATEGEWMHADELDVPTMIGEFHFGASDERMFSPGLIAAATQEDRGTMYAKYVTDLLESKTFVGGQWFQYIDQPATGRSWDGENYNAGFVDVVDVPYYPLVEAAKEVHSKQYEIKYGNGAVVEKVEITMPEAVAIDGEVSKTAQIKAEVTPVGTELVWESSNNNIATVDQAGVVTAVADGEVVITVKAKGNLASKKTCKVTITNVTEKEVTSVKVTEAVTIDGKENKSVALKAEVTPVGKELVWSSSDEKIATVDQTGVVTAVADGEVDIVVSVKDEANVKAVCKVTVTNMTDTEEPEVPEEKTIALQETATIDATKENTVALEVKVTPETEELVWSSSDEKVATVNDKGLVTAVGNGMAIITASIKSDLNIKADCEVTVSGVDTEEPEVPEEGGSKVTMTPATCNARLYRKVQLNAELAGNDKPGRVVGWVSSDQSVATVDADGLVTTHKVGTVVITATSFENKDDYAECQMEVFPLDAEIPDEAEYSNK